MYVTRLGKYFFRIFWNFILWYDNRCQHWQYVCPIVNTSKYVATGTGILSSARRQTNSLNYTLKHTWIIYECKIRYSWMDVFLFVFKCLCGDKDSESSRKQIDTTCRTRWPLHTTYENTKKLNKVEPVKLNDSWLNLVYLRGISFVLSLSFTSVNLIPHILILIILVLSNSFSTLLDFQRL